MLSSPQQIQISLLLEQKEKEINELKRRLQQYSTYEILLNELNDFVAQLTLQFENQEKIYQDQFYKQKLDLENLLLQLNESQQRVEVQQEENQLLKQQILTIQNQQFLIKQENQFLKQMKRNSNINTVEQLDSSSQQYRVISLPSKQNHSNSQERKKPKSQIVNINNSYIRQ